MMVNVEESNVTSLLRTERGAGPQEGVPVATAGRPRVRKLSWVISYLRINHQSPKSTKNYFEQETVSLPSLANFFDKQR